MHIGPGRQLGRFQVERLLGSGGGADTWAVRDLHGARFALKLPHPEARLSERLLREGRLQATLDHPNLLPVLEVLELAGRPALLMPLIEGPSLDVLLARHRPSRADALALLRGVVSGVACAHARGLVHRDLKPANVLLAPDAGGIRPVVADFGVARPAAPDGLRTGTGALLGTPAYMAPEQLHDASRVDGRADLWSLGVLLHELLTGRLPFPAESLPELLRAWRSPLPLDGLSEEDAGLIGALLQVDPAARLPDCETLRACLDALGAEAAPGGALAEAARAWTPPPAPALALPAPPTDFVGRADDLIELGARLVGGPERLHTLTGPGGAGKTRLAIELARRSAAGWPGGVRFVDLSRVRDRAGVLSALARALTLSPGEDPAARVAAALRASGRALLVLDNLEQLLDQGLPGLLTSWLAEAPELVVLGTSRASLKVEGERACPVRPLGPVEGEALFLRRARAARPDLLLGPEDAPALPRLLDLLDGLPLAIELAAARCRTMRVTDLAAHLDQRWRLLKVHDPALPPRHRALRAALQGSWDLLDAAARRDLAILSVFEGGFTPEAAAATLDRPPLDTHERLGELAELGLLQLREGPGGPRGHLLHAVAAFAREQLHEPDAALLRHARFFAARSLPDREGRPEPYERLQPEHGNLLLAAASAARAGEPDLAAEAARTAARLAARQGAVEATEAVVRRVRALPGLSPRSRGRLGLAELELLQAAGRLAEAEALATQLLTEPHADLLRCELLLAAARVAQLRLRPQASEALLAEATPLLRRLADPWLDARAEHARAMGLLHACALGEALRCAQRAATLALEVQDPLLELQARAAEWSCLLRAGRLAEAGPPLRRGLELAGALRHAEHAFHARQHLGELAWAIDDLEGCREAWQEADRISRRLGNLEHRRLAAINLAALDFRVGRLDEAERALRELLPAARRAGAELHATTLLTNLGYLYHRLGRSDEATPLLEEALDLCAKEAPRRRMHALNWLAVTLIEAGRFDEARGHLTSGAASGGAAGDVPWEAATRDALGLLHLHQGDLEAAEAHLRAALAGHAATDTPYVAAIATCHLGGLLSERGARDEARALLDAAVALGARAGMPVVEGSALSERGLLHAREGQHGEATACLRRAGALLTPTRDQPELLSHELRCAEAARRRGEPDLARACLAGAALRLDALGWRPEARARRRLLALEAEQTVNS